MQRRTALITAGSLAAVVLTGATAVGANVGILSSADQSPFGQLNAVAGVGSNSSDLTTPTVVDVFVDESSSTPVTGSLLDNNSQLFSVDGAGTLELTSSESALRLGEVKPAAGWTWSSTQTTDTDLIVTFQSDASVLEFVASLGADGAITARVDQPLSGSPTTTGGGYDEYDDDDEYEDHDEHEDDDEYEDDEYEGREDDD